jgi:hypothetical protein
VGVLMDLLSLYSTPMLLRSYGSTPWVCSQVSLPFPKHNPSLHRSSQRKKGMFPLGNTSHHRSPRFSFSHPNIFVHPIDSFLLMLFICPSLNPSKEHVCSVGGFTHQILNFCFFPFYRWGFSKVIRWPLEVDKWLE